MPAVALGCLCAPARGRCPGATTKARQRNPVGGSVKHSVHDFGTTECCLHFLQKIIKIKFRFQGQLSRQTHSGTENSLRGGDGGVLGAAARKPNMTHGKWSDQSRPVQRIRRASLRWRWNHSTWPFPFFRFHGRWWSACAGYLTENRGQPTEIR